MLEALNQNFSIRDHLLFEPHASGLIQGKVKTDHCTGSFFLLGGHPAEFQPRTERHPVLFLSRKAVFEVGKPIRGGVPICFPWFGPNKVDSTAPSHGTVRTKVWNVHKTEMTTRGAVVVHLRLVDGAFELTFRLAFDASLDMELTVVNRTDNPQTCEIALHTYLTLGDVHRASVSGLEKNHYRDQLTGTTMAATGRPIQFTEETDRVYVGAVEKISIADSGNGRTINLQPRNSLSTVVWNPWIAKSQRLTDFGDQEYLQMCCIETANVAPDQWTIPANQSQSIGVKISAHDQVNN
jgi:glucose-6-phosphate 1-epimerase